MKEGWVYKKLGEVGTVITGSTPSTKDKDNYNSCDVCFVKPSDIPKDSIGMLSDTEFYITEKAYNNSRKLPKGSVLTTCIGIVGKVGVLKVNATCNQQINAIIPHSDISSTFLAYSLFSKRFYFEHIANAPVVPIINKKEFSNTQIPVPPLSEQERIVSELDFLSSIIEKKKAQLKEYDQLAQSIFLDMFGDPVTNEKGWELKQLKDVTIKMGSGATPRGGNQSYKTEGISLIRSLNVHNGSFKYEDLAHIDITQAEQLNNVVVEKNDVLLNITGASVARCCVVPSNVLPARVNQHVSILRPDCKKLDYSFLCRLLISDKSQNELLLLSKSNGATREALPKSILEKYKILLPPLPLQQSFASKIEAIERQKALIQQSITEAETLFNSRMDYWFS